MDRVERRLLHYRSPLDGAQQPYIVSAPADYDGQTPLSAVVLLHDALSDPTPAGFVEEAFRQAQQWLEPVSDNSPLLLVQPFGRGNGGWLGAATVELFATLSAAAGHWRIDDDAISLLGVGMGATGALQLACWHPDRFSAAAAVGAWGDERLDLPVGQRRWPKWERAQRRAVCPVALACNLSRFPVHLEHPWWFAGLAGAAGRDHFAALVAAFRKHEVALRVETPPPSISGERRSPSRPTELLGWLLSHRRQPAPKRFTFKTYVPRANGAFGICVERLSCPGRPAIVKAKHKGDELRLRTRGVQALRLQLLADATIGRLRIDRQEIELPIRSDVDASMPIHLEKLSRGWQAIAQATDAPLDGAAQWNVKTADRGGPVLDLFWGSALFVAGSLGTGQSNELHRQLADELCRRWQTGEESSNPHPGNRASSLPHAARVDAEVTDEQMAQHHLVLIGTPRDNLLLARFLDHLPCRWKFPEATDECDDAGQCSGIVFGGQEYDNPDDLLVFLTPNPDLIDRYLLVITGVASRSLPAVARLPLTHLPDYLVFRGDKVLQRGYFGADWR